MVELYELKLMPIDGDNNWPPDIDEHVAQLDFGTSMMDAQSVCFGSVIADPTLSTDSLDMDTMLRRCQDNKNNDYKLTFEDSGQWTTSGIGGSFTTTHTTTASPPTPQSRRVLNMLRKGANNSILVHDADNHNISLRLLEELNNGAADDGEDEEEEDQAKTAIRWRDKLLDEILNNNGGGGASTEFDGKFTTWGRISRKSAVQSPPFDSDNVNSLPELGNERRNRNGDGGKNFPENFSAKACVSSSSIARHQQQSATMEPSGRAQTAGGRPGSLVSNFIGQFHAKAGADEDGQAQSPIDYEYSEHYIGNGRYIDMNDNEIGFVPPSNAPIQGRNGSGGYRRYQSHDSPGKTAASSSGGPCRRSESVRTGLATNNSSSPRTFADLSPSRTAPDLKFIALSHKVPSICASSASFDNLLKQARHSTTFDGVLECCANSEKLLSENDQEGSEIPDSGLGSSHSDGPSHIEDWPSLSVLLPRPVVDACSFFKTNAFLLSGSSNSIERRRSPPPPPRSFTSTGICRRWEQLESRPGTACPNCCFGGSEAASSISKSAILGGAGEPSPRRRHSTQRLRLHARELALIGLPIYDQKRTLVERVVEGVAEVLRGGSCIVLLAALEKLLGDGLKYGVRTWQVIRGVTGPGPVTASVFQLIEELEANEKPENSRISHFLQGLVSLHSVDGWFSYIVLKEGALRQFYTDSAFFIGASTSYRSLFARFVECLELLSVLNQCGIGKRAGALLAQKRRKQHSLNTIADHNPLSSAAKLPSDSRVPKSSSVPTKLTNKSNNIGEEEDELEIEGQHGKDFTKNVPEILEPAQSETARPSKIPILRSRSKSTHSIQSNNSQRSSKMSTARVCHVRERVDENECEQRKGTVLPADKGESVKVLSVRGPYSRCARIGLKRGRRNLAIWNGIVPTEKLVVMEDGC